MPSLQDIVDFGRKFKGKNKQDAAAVQLADMVIALAEAVGEITKTPVDPDKPPSSDALRDKKSAQISPRLPRSLKRPPSQQ